MATAAVQPSGVRLPKVGARGHSPGLLQTVQAEGDAACGLSAEPKAAQTLPLGLPLRQRQASVGSRPQHHTDVTPILPPILGEQICWGTLLLAPRLHHLKANMGLPTVNQGTPQPQLRVSSLTSGLLILPAFDDCSLSDGLEGGASNSDGARAISKYPHFPRSPRIAV